MRLAVAQFSIISSPGRDRQYARNASIAAITQTVAHQANAFEPMEALNLLSRSRSGGTSFGWITTAPVISAAHVLPGCSRWQASRPGISSQ